MKFAREFLVSTVVGGLFVVVPVYLAVLLLLKGMKSAGTLIRPFAALLLIGSLRRISSRWWWCSYCGTRARSRCPVHSGGEDHLAMGLRLEKPGGCDEERRGGDLIAAARDAQRGVPATLMEEVAGGCFAKRCSARSGSVQRIEAICLRRCTGRAL